MIGYERATLGNCEYVVCMPCVCMHVHICIKNTRTHTSEQNACGSVVDAVHACLRQCNAHAWLCVPCTAVCIMRACHAWPCVPCMAMCAMHACHAWPCVPCMAMCVMHACHSSTACTLGHAHCRVKWQPRHTGTTRRHWCPSSWRRRRRGEDERCHLTAREKAA